MLGTEPATDAMSEADTLLMIGPHFPILSIFLNQDKRGIQIDIKAEKIGLRYPVEVGLTGIKKYCLLCFLYFGTEEQWQMQQQLQ